MCIKMEQCKIDKGKINQVIIEMVELNAMLDIYGLLNEMLSWLNTSNSEFYSLKAYDNDDYDLGQAFGDNYLALAKAIHNNRLYNPDKELFIINDDNIISLSQDEYNETVMSSKNKILNGYINKFGFDKSVELIEHHTH